MAGERTKSTALLLVIAVFVLGVAVGALGMYAERNRVLGAAAQPHPQLTAAEFRAKRVADLTQQLNLNPDQAKQLDAVLLQMHNQIWAIHDQENVQRDQVSKQSREQIRAFLSADQVTKFNDFLQKMDEQRKKDEDERKKRNGTQ
jgi:Spy/CpxP family protein refolding chaperone